MSRMPPASYFANRDAPTWNDDPSYEVLDPTDRDEYDDFANERSQPHPNLPARNVQVSAKGSIRTSYQSRNTVPAAYSSNYSSQNSRETRPVTPPRHTYTPEYAGYDGPYGSPGRGYEDHRQGPSPMRVDSPTRQPLTGAAASYAGYELPEAKPGGMGGGPPTSQWLREEKKSRRKRKYIIIGIIIFVLLAAAAGVTVYLVKFRSTGSAGSSGSSNGRNGFGATSSDLKTDSSLHRIFDGMDYTPINAQYPGCGSIQANVTADVAILSQLTTKVRLYGTDCQQATMVLDAIQSLKVDMTVFVGVWVDRNATTLARQLSDMYSILKTYPVGLIEGIAVGNEVLFRQDKTEQELIQLIQQVRANVTAMNLGKKIPICTSDLGSMWTSALASAVDCVMANIHPFFAGVNVTGAADWTIQFLDDNVVPTTAGLSPKPPIIISEVGWPSQGGAVNSSVAGIQELQYFINTFPNRAKSANVTYYWFEGYDEPWKIQFDTATEQYEDHWGLLDVNGYLKKGITLPSSV